MGVPGRRGRAARYGGALALAVAGTMALGAPSAFGQQPVVVAEDYAFVPTEPTIEQGELLAFLNQDADLHDVTHGPDVPQILFASPTFIGPNQQRNVEGTQFLAPGSYPFYCTVHPYMTGTLHVEGVHPDLAVVLTGTHAGGSEASLAADDNDYYRVRSTTSGTTRWAAFGAAFAGVPNDLSSLEVAYRGLASRACTQFLAIRDFSRGVWVLLDMRTAGPSEVTVEGTPAGDPADYVSGDSGAGHVAIAVGCRAGTNFGIGGELAEIEYQARGYADNPSALGPRPLGLGLAPAAPQAPDERLPGGGGGDRDQGAEGSGSDAPTIAPIPTNGWMSAARRAAR